MTHLSTALWPGFPLHARAWITGAGGLIGGHLVRSAGKHAPFLSLRPLTRKDLDLADSTAVRRLFEAEKPSLVIHCAAMTNTAECEKKPQAAWEANVNTTALLCELCECVPFVFFSTDLVFDGRDGNYSEDAAVHPLSIYGETKAAAERRVLQNPLHLVIRTSLNGGVSATGDRGFNEQLRRAWARGETPRLFVDEFRSPISAAITARATWELVNQNAAGMFHVAGSERLSRFQIGELLAARWPALSPRVERASLKEYQGSRRAPDTSLDCAKAQALLSFPLPGLSEWLEAHPREVF